MARAETAHPAAAATPTQEHIVSVRDVVVEFDGTRALDGVSVAIGSGIVGLLGPNGAGKSTLFRALLGLQPIIAGEIDVLGWALPESARRVRAEVGYMPEDDSLFPELRASEQVVHAARLSGLGRVDAQSAAHRALDRVLLGPERYRPAAALSLGGRQRLRLAMALVHGPRLLLLDEPTSGFDPEARAEMLDLIAEIGAAGTAIVLSTHVLGDVEAICGDVIVLSRGKLAFQGPVARFRAAQRPGGGTLVALDGDATALAARLQLDGIPCEAEGERLRVFVASPLPVAFWTACVELGCGVRTLEPLMEGMAEAFVRHLRLDDPSRRVGGVQ